MSAGYGQPFGSGTYRLKRAVVAVEGDDGAVAYLFGWVGPGDIDVNMEREKPWSLQGRYGDPEWSTSVKWALPPTWTARYPSDDDFAKQLPGARDAIGPGAR